MTRLGKIGIAPAIALVLLVGVILGQETPSPPTIAQNGIQQPRQGRRQVQPRPGRLNPNRPRLGANQRQGLMQEVVRRLGLTQDQQLRLRDIAREFNERLAVAGRRARLSRRALDEAILSERYDESRVNQLADDWATEQAQFIKIRALRRAALRRVLTPEQMIRMTEMEREFGRRQQERLDDDAPNPRRVP